jgi:hypothetical protein
MLGGSDGSGTEQRGELGGGCSAAATATRAQASRQPRQGNKLAGRL